MYGAMINLPMSRHEVYGYEKLIFFGLYPLLHHIFKRLSIEQDDKNSHDCECHSESHLKCKHGQPCQIL